MANLTFVFEEIKDADAGASVELDTTLTKAGAAAEAFAVGKAITKAFAKAKEELADYAKKTDLAGFVDEEYVAEYVARQIGVAITSYDENIKAYIDNTFLNGAW